MPIYYKSYADSTNPTVIATVTVAILLTTVLTAGCAPQTQVVEVEVTVAPQVNVVEVTATPEPTIATTPEPIAVLSFVDSGQRLGEGRSWDVSLGDLDGDNDLDAFVVDDGQADARNAVWLNDGHGSFAISEQIPGYGRGLDLGDLDGDGDLDAFVTHWEEASQVWLNDGAGAFSDSGQNFGDGGGFDVALGDLDGDGDLDAFVAQMEANTVWLNDGGVQGGTFGVFSDTGQRLGIAITAAVVLGDLDGDGDLDALAGGWDEPAKVWLNDGKGAFTDSGHDLSPANVHIHGIALGDVDGDGDLDAFMAIASGDPNEVWLNDGSGVFEHSGQELRSPLAHSVSMGDLDGDGDLDALMAIGRILGSKVWLNEGGVQGGTPGFFTDSGLSLGDLPSYAVGLGDLDGDGDLDAFVTHADLSREKGGGKPDEVWLNEAIPVLTSSGEGSGEIAFVSERDGNLEVYVMNADGSDPRRLTDYADMDAYPDWSPDGSKIALHAHHGSRIWSIYTMNEDGSNRRRLTDSETRDAAPVWSPDGTQIVFSRDGDVWVMNTDGSDQQQLTTNPADDSFVDWSPDGTQIVFCSDRDGNWEVYVMNADGTDQRRLTDNDADDWWPDWSPDGAQIALKTNRDGNFEIYVMNADGTDQRRLTNNDAEDGEPDWSPDGAQIAFESNRDGNFEIYVMNADGTNPRRLTDNRARDMMPVWRPDGS
jgi:Tol biopolymer transport system component